MKMTKTLFLVAWNSSSCITEVSVKLRRAGFPHMEPSKCRHYARMLRDLGEKLKAIPRSDLPSRLDATPGETKMELVLSPRKTGSPATRVEVEVSLPSKGRSRVINSCSESGFMLELSRTIRDFLATPPA